MSYFTDAYREMLFPRWLYHDNILRSAAGFLFIISVTDEIILCLFKHDCVPTKRKAEIIKDNPNLYTLTHSNLQENGEPILTLRIWLYFLKLEAKLQCVI